MQPPNNRRLAFIVVTIILFFVLVSGVSVFLLHKTKHTPTATNGSEQYYDPGSHETVSNPTGKSPETYGTDGSQTLYLGFSNLLASGFSNYQLNAFEQALKNYTTTTKRTITSFSIDVTSINAVPHDQDDPGGSDSLYFNMTLNRTETHKIRLEYFDISSVRLYIYDDSNQVTYDSGTVDSVPDSL